MKFKPKKFPTKAEYLRAKKKVEAWEKWHCQFDFLRETKEEDLRINDHIITVMSAPREKISPEVILALKDIMKPKKKFYSVHSDWELTYHIQFVYEKGTIIGPQKIKSVLKALREFKMY